MKITKLANITFTYPLWIEETRHTTTIESENQKTINGSLVIFEQYNKKSAISLTCISMDNGWMHKDTLDALIALSNASLGQTYTATLSDGSVKNVIFNHENTAVNFEPIYEGSEYYRGTIQLLEVE